ncbi:hypothetical protein [Nonomuraea sp. CA-141351]|uniref:hypothetical protein n=1 Tax=Nonomuraea sp. CA-141351 TaxID=3239996 RepID=UPI003D8D7F4E
MWDADQQWKADLPYLAVQIDRLLREDLSAPAGWAAVAAVLALTCGANLGRRLERELQRRRGWPLVMEWWDQPLERSWIWLPPHERRHPAFARLGAGASLAAIIEALQRHDPTLPQQAQRLCRDAQVRWRPALWPAAIAYAAAFTTQAAERDRHRKPVHVVDSTSDGLSQIRPPFAVTGDAINVEGGLQELLEYLLFPLLLGHGLRDEPREPRCIYGIEPDDDRPERSRSDARITHEVDRANQIAVVLGQIPGVPNAQMIWDGAAPPARNGAPLGATAPVHAGISEIRQAARIQVAGQMYDEAGPIAMIADEAWERAGWWIPSDDPAYAVRQAHAFLRGRPLVNVLWAGHRGMYPEPTWIPVRVIAVNEHGTGFGDVPGLHVLNGESLLSMRLSDIALVRRADPTPINAGSAPAAAEEGTRYDTAYVIDPTAEQAWRLVGHKIHQLAHDDPQAWRALDHLASKCRERMWTLPTEHGQDVTVALWLRLSDTEVACDDPSCQARIMYLTDDGTSDGGHPASGPLPEFARNNGLAYFTFTTHPHEDAWAASKDPAACAWMYTALALYGGFMRVDWMDFSASDAVSMGRAAWEVRDYQETEIRRVVITSRPDGLSQTETGDPDYAWPPLPPEIAAELEQKSRARQAR